MLNITRNGWVPATIRITILCSLIGLVMMYATPVRSQVPQGFAQAQTVWLCGNTKSIADGLTQANESVIALGKTQVGNSERADPFLMSLWTAKNGEWSIIATSQKNSDISCVVLVGSQFTYTQPQGTPILQWQSTAENPVLQKTSVK